MINDVTTNTFSRTELGKVFSFLCREVLQEDRQKVLDTVFGKGNKEVNANRKKKDITWSDLIVVLDRYGLKPSLTFSYEENKQYHLILIRDSVNNKLQQQLIDNIKKRKVSLYEPHPDNKDVFGN
jgi:hypothetical protein